jgi:hypothetical protein
LEELSEWAELDASNTHKSATTKVARLGLLSGGRQIHHRVSEFFKDFAALSFTVDCAMSSLSVLFAISLLRGNKYSIGRLDLWDGPLLRGARKAAEPLSGF